MIRSVFRCLPSLLLAACLSGEDAPPPTPPPDPVAGMVRVRAALDEAVRYDADARDREAVASWCRAHAAFSGDVEPALRATLPARDVAAFEYRFGRVRSEIEIARGRPGPAVETLLADLEARIATAGAGPQ